ncbi:putative leishmanolysin-like peptidase [Apostichopus japonicus]|uniref:Leishmanolysin-like peptidase n=1 Tax=Stichopus japonicus TaxID=307972 RepID=A0A2G8KKN4_STIJA|nr:putative leishmanolysin-like peptidase [Apostichopus japonicus]
MLLARRTKQRKRFEVLGYLFKAIWLFSDHLIWFGKIKLIQIDTKRWGQRSAWCWLAANSTLDRDLYKLQQLIMQAEEIKQSGNSSHRGNLPGDMQKRQAKMRMSLAPISTKKKDRSSKERTGKYILVRDIVPLMSGPKGRIAHKHFASKHNKFRTGVYVDSSHTVQKRSDSQPLRIHVEFDSELDELPENYVNLVKNDLLPTAVKFLSQRINVRRPLSSPLLLYRDCNDGRTYRQSTQQHQFCWNECHKTTYCERFKIPERHLQACYECNENIDTCRSNGNIPAGQGLPHTDFVLYVQVADTRACMTPDTTAHASYCQLESFLDRPIAGYINICPSALSMNEADRNILLTTVKHEIIHSLGFSSSLFAFYRDDNGEPLTPRDANGMPPFNMERFVYQWSDRVIKQVKRYDWDTRNGLVIHSVQVMVTPKVKEEARRHFNCDSLEGIELENDGGGGTMFSHFEKRLLENEAMTGTHTHDRQFSRFTLAVLEDTGWYHVNYDLADQLVWVETWDAISSRRAASRGWILGKAERTSLAICNLKKYEEDLPLEYQQVTYTNDKGQSKGTTCYLASNSLASTENVAAEYFGPQSICVNHASPWIREKCLSFDKQITWGAGCYQYHCSQEGLKIVIEGVNYLCLSEGRALDVSVKASYRHQGAIICPACKDFCDECPLEESSGLSIKEPGDEGECPRLPADAVGICITECESDRECGRNKKCCSNGCGQVCKEQVKTYNEGKFQFQIVLVTLFANLRLTPVQEIVNLV